MTHFINELFYLDGISLHFAFRLFSAHVTASDGSGGGALTRVAAAIVVLMAALMRDTRGGRMEDLCVDVVVVVDVVVGVKVVVVVCGVVLCV